MVDVVEKDFTPNNTSGLSIAECINANSKALGLHEFILGMIHCGLCWSLKPIIR